MVRLSRSVAGVILALSIVGVPSPGVANIPDPLPLQLWAVRDQTDSGSSAVADIATSRDGTRTFVTGEGGRLGGEIVTIARDTETGAVLWERRHDAGVGVGRALEVSPDGTRLYVTSHGYESSTETAFTVTIAYATARGEELWAARTEGVWGYAITLSADGSRIFVAGTSGPWVNEMTVVAYDNSGVWLWQTFFVDPTYTNSGAGSVVAAGNDKVIVTGAAGTPSEQIGVGYTVAFDQTDGALAWATPRPTTGPLAIAPDATRVFVTGSTLVKDAVYGWRMRGYVTDAFDVETGSLLWTATYSVNLPVLGPWDQAFDIGVAPDGLRVYVTGFSGTGLATLMTAPVGHATVAYDATLGQELWSARPPTGAGSSGARELVVSPDGLYVFVTGEAVDVSETNPLCIPPCSGDSDFLTSAYSALTGAQLWSAHFERGATSTDVPMGLAITPDGTRLFVTGYSRPNWFSPRSLATVAYCTIGSLATTPCPALS